MSRLRYEDEKPLLPRYRRDDSLSGNTSRRKHNQRSMSRKSRSSVDNSGRRRRKQSSRRSLNLLPWMISACVALHLIYIGVLAMGRMIVLNRRRRNVNIAADISSQLRAQLNMTTTTMSKPTFNSTSLNIQYQCFFQASPKMI